MSEKKRRLAWRSAPRPVRRREIRDQWGLRIGWVRFWLRAIALGAGLWVIAASLGLWPPLRFLVPLFLLAGLFLMPAGGLLALASWILPLPHEHPARCPGCGHEARVLRLPRTVAFTCPYCHRKGALLRGEIHLPAEDVKEGRS